MIWTQQMTKIFFPVVPTKRESGFIRTVTTAYRVLPEVLTQVELVILKVLAVRVPEEPPHPTRNRGPFAQREVSHGVIQLWL